MSTVELSEAAERVNQQYPSTAKAWWVVAILSLLYAISMMDRYIIGLLVKDIRSDLGISDFQIGLLHGLTFAVFFVLFGLVFGRMADRYSRRHLIYGGVTVWSVATIACGLARTLPQLAGARFCVGAGEAALNPAAYSILSDNFPPARRSLALSVFGSAANVGLGFSFLAGGFLIAAMPPAGFQVPVIGHLAAWQAVFIAAGAPGLVVGILIWTIADPNRREVSATAGTRYVDALRFIKDRWRFYFGHFTGYALLAAVANGAAAWAPAYMARNFKIPVTEIVVILATLPLTFGVIGTIVAGSIVDYFFVRGVKDVHLRLFMVTALMQLVLLVLAAMAGSLGAFITFFGAYILLNSWTGVATAAIPITTPNQFRGQVSSIYLAVFNLIGLGVGPALVGAINTFWFKNDAMLGWSIAAAGIILLPVGILALWSSLRPMRSAVASASSWAPDASGCSPTRVVAE